MWVKWHFNMLLILHWCWDLFAALKICYFWYHKTFMEWYLCTGDSRLWNKLSGSTNELRCWKYKRICTTNLIETILYRNFVADKMAEQGMLISFVGISKKLRRGIRKFYCNRFQTISIQSSFLHKQLRGVHEWPF